MANWEASAVRGRGGPPTPWWLCLLLLPLVPFLALVAWLPFTMPVVLPVAVAWDYLAGRRRRAGC